MNLRWSGFALSYDPVQKAGPFLTTSIPIDKLKFKTRVQVLFCCSEFLLNRVDVISGALISYRNTGKTGDMYSVGKKSVVYMLFFVEWTLLLVLQI